MVNRWLGGGWGMDGGVGESLSSHCKRFFNLKKLPMSFAVLRNEFFDDVNVNRCKKIFPHNFKTIVQLGPN